MNERRNLRELVSDAIHSSDLSQSDLRETHIDRIGALAFADALGGALWALKWAGEARAYTRALALLAHRSRAVCGGSEMRFRLCKTALIEWLHDLCGRCLGRRELPATPESPSIPCPVCQGSGLRKISEVWRAGQLGLDREQYRKWAPRFAAVQCKIIDAESSAWHDIARQLGRVPQPVAFVQPEEYSTRTRGQHAARGRV